MRHPRTGVLSEKEREKPASDLVRRANFAGRPTLRRWARAGRWVRQTRVHGPERGAPRPDGAPACSRAIHPAAASNVAAWSGDSFWRCNTPEAQITCPCAPTRTARPSPPSARSSRLVRRSILVRLLFAVRWLLELLTGCSADVPVLGVPGKDGSVRNYVYGELEAATNLLANSYARVIPPRARGDAASKLTCALLAPSGYDCEHELERRYPGETC